MGSTDGADWRPGYKMLSSTVTFQNPTGIFSKTVRGEGTERLVGEQAMWELVIAQWSLAFKTGVSG